MLFDVPYKTLAVISVVAFLIGYVLIKHTKVLSAAGTDTTNTLHLF